MARRESHLGLDAANMFSDAVGPEHGLRQDELDGLAGRIERSTAAIAEMRGEAVGFMELPGDEGLVETVRRKAQELRSHYKNFVVLGAGGSALGNITIHTALQHPYHNLLPAGHPARRGAPRIFVVDNLDPDWLIGLLDVLSGELPETAFNVISKSGSTAATMSQFLHVRELLQRTKGCDPVRQIILTTDPRPEESLLRRISRRDGYYALPIPPNVGGRFSVLSAVGLLSAAVGGLDIAGMLGGASAMEERCRSARVRENPAALYACLLYLQCRRGKPISVLMPYSHFLRGLADWYCQLWAESLGKRDGLSEKDVFTGPTPVASVGTTDEHSMMQLYQDGPFDKVITFVEVQEGREPLPICEGQAEPELRYLTGRTFQDLFSAELEATRRAMRHKHRPNCTIRIPRVDEEALGELFMFYEYAVAYSGRLYEVNAYDQPGVELAKNYTYGLMGREGYEPPPP